MRLKDYLNRVEQIGFTFDDLYIIKDYILGEGRIEDFSSMYIDLLTKAKEENEYIDRARKEMLLDIGAVKNPNYTHEQNAILDCLIVQYAMYGNLDHVRLDIIKDKIAEMELPTWCLKDVLKCLVEDYNINFKTPYVPDKDYYYSRFREVMKKRAELEKKKYNMTIESMNYYNDNSAEDEKDDK